MVYTYVNLTKMNFIFGLVCTIIIALAVVLPCTVGVVINRVQKLDDDYNVSWKADLEKRTIEFEVIAKTTGFVGFGLSPQGGMNHADVVIGGIRDGKSYFTDRFATGKTEPKVDDHQDWHLTFASENSTHTILRFNRTFNTCDDEDLPINNDTTKFIWSMGATDDIKYHTKRGASSVYVLDPAPPIFDGSKYEAWHMNVNTIYPTAETSYWCTVHKSPKFSAKKHIVGFRVKLYNELSLAHNHHMTLHRCSNPPGSNLSDVYESYLRKPGGECHEDDGSGIINNVMPTCQTVYYIWAKGGDPMFLPENAGIPLNEDGTEEYFVLEVHFDNPQVKPNVQYDTGLEIYMTSNLREQDAGLLLIAHDTAFTMVIPPAAPNYVVSGHCSKECTQSQLPPEGIQFFNVLLHAHLAGRKLKLRHFRDGVELPWVSSDDFYDFNYQQNRLLAENRKILPGDQFALECTYNSSYLNPPEAVIGGLSTRHEMCFSIIMYYPRLKNLSMCASVFYDYEFLFQKFGIKSADFETGINDPIITSPPEMYGKYFSTVLSTMVDWNPELRHELQQVTRYGNQTSLCFAMEATTRNVVKAEDMPVVTYPLDFIPYDPPSDNCN